jgi:hypothetical protein
MENIAGYVYDHTTRNGRRWLELEADQQGPYFVSTVHDPRTAEFLRFARLQTETHTCCDPLDGRVHNLKEMTRWIGIRELAVRFIGLGVILGVFELVRPWVRREHENDEDMIKRLERDNDAQFRLTAKQVLSLSSMNTKPGSRFGGAATSKPNFIESSSERGPMTLPMSSSTISARKRLPGRRDTRLTRPCTWPTVRSIRFRQV